MSEALTAKGYETFYPRYKAASRNPEPRQGATTSVKPLFPGYLFSKFDVHARLPILTVPGVVNIVSSGRIPVPLDSSEIESLKVLINSNLPIGPHPYLAVGDRVTISNGPLAGAGGCIVQADRTRLVVSITLLQRSVAVEVAVEWLEKVRENATQPRTGSWITNSRAATVSDITTLRP